MYESASFLGAKQFASKLAFGNAKLDI